MRPTVSDRDSAVVTGIGVVSPIGVGKQAFWGSLDEGRSGIKPINLFDTRATRSKLGAEVKDFKPEDIIGPQGLRNNDRCINLALSATKLALEDASLTINESNSRDFGIVLGSSLGSIRTTSELDKQSIIEGPRSIDPGKCPNVVLCGPASQISIRFGIRGFTVTISTGFTSTFGAFKYALDLLRSKRVKYILVGAVEEFCEQIFKGFHRLGYLSGSRNGSVEINAPYDRRRNGFVLGEGAVMFVLERESEAEERKARCYARISRCEEQFVHCDSQVSLSYSFRHIDYIASKFFSALNSDLDTIDFVGLGGNSSVLGDALESHVMGRLFFERKKYPLAAAIKSLVGEAYSAGGSFQLLGALYALDRQRVFPTIGFEVEDERCPVPFLRGQRPRRSICKALIWSVGYSRVNCYVVCDKI